MSTDKLVELLTDQQPAKIEEALYELCNTISNIVSSYDDPYDAFAELVQNALDATAAARELNQDGFIPEISVNVDVSRNTLTVCDNGTGIGWEQRKWAVKPNYSLKRRLGQRSSRGEKGAALTFLQFGHSEFSLKTQTDQDSWKYTIVDGRNWFERTYKILDEAPSDPTNIGDHPQAEFALERVDRDDDSTSGTTASVRFPDNRLSELLGDDPKIARKRLEYILLTRTGIGFYIHNSDNETLAPWQKDLQVSVSLTMGTDTSNWSVKPGFLFPHVMAKQAGARKSSLLTASKKNSELLFDYFDESWIKKYLERISKNPRHMDVIHRFEVRGYVSYAFHNSWYEDVSAKHLELPADDTDTSVLAESLIQVNGGFLVAVRDFPTGRRKSFLHRSGAEHKSRTFVLLNFGGDYKPDYGRKNLSAEAHALVLDLCKALIAFTSDKRDALFRGTQQSAHNAKNTHDAGEALKEDAKRMQSRGLLIKSGDRELSRAPATETEVVAEFVRLVSNNILPGFEIYGFLARGILDGYFDYGLSFGKNHMYDVDEIPFGVAFSEGRDLKSSGQWMEFKVRSDALIDDIKKNAGESGKKYFSLIDLLICESIDTATDKFELIEINEDNYDERKYFGVTHLLESSENNEHKIQVICLQKLREILAGTGKISELREVTPLEE